MAMNRPRSRPEARRRLCGAVLIGLPVLVSNAWAADGIQVQPRLSLQTLLTDNNGLTTNARDAALVTTLSPGISLASRGGRVVGTLDYSLSGIAYAKSIEPDRVQQSLRAVAAVDVIEGTLTVDSVASILQQSASALGTQTIDGNLANPNRTEIASLSVSPTLRGRLGSLASVQVRGTASESRSKGSDLGDTRQGMGSVALNGLGGGLVSWYANLTAQQTRYIGHDNRSNDVQAWVGLSYRPDVDFSAALHGGGERSNYLAGSAENSAIFGGSFGWIPSPRTKVSGEWMRHSYGNSHSLNVEYRMARSALRFSDSQSVNLTPQLSSTSLGSIYDILFLQYASIEPDPIQRDQLVRGFLAANGVNPSTELFGKVLSNAPTIARSQQLSYSVSGVRTSFVLSASRSSTERVGSSSGLEGDLALFARIVQRGVSAVLTHRLTPSSSISAGYTLSHNGGDGGSSLLGNDTQLNAATLSWNGQLARRTSISLTLRHAQSDGIASYRENAASVILTQLF